MQSFQWSNVKRFNFTYAINDGAWLETGSYQTSDGPKTQLGRVWLDTQLKAQGWMTGCWIDCVPVVHREPLKPIAINGKAVA